MRTVLPSIKFLFKKKISLPDRRRLKVFIHSLFKKYKQPLDALSITFCDDEEILEINRRYLQHDYYTDIITFDLTERMNEPTTAALFISADTVKSNSIINGTKFQRELHRVIFHGLLHLVGFNDKTQQEQTLMRKMEDAALKEYFK